MSISMSYDYITKPATEGQVLELLRKIEEDERKIDYITEDYARMGMTPDRVPEYEKIADRIRLRFSLAEGYWAEIQAREDREDEELKFWTNKQLELADLWDWDE